ncbi:MAG TPA: hypothetical protein VNO30_25805 [Kofleriaceae bacterium]|nr:hypothetical protein [Kofleriaceae bacterium]
MIGLAISTMPLVWIVVVAIAMVSAWALGMVVAYIDRPQLQELQPEAVLSQEIRGAYRAILSAFADLAQLVEETPRLRASVAPALERCRAAVATCGQMARHADLLQRYLDRHDRTHICLELERLQERRGDAADAPRNLAAAARARQLATYDEIVGQRDLLRARLELVRVAIESFTATLVKLRGADRKQPALGDPAIIGQLDEVCR